MKFKIKKGDNVLVTTGKEKGKTGTVLRVIAETGRVVIDGVNMYKKFVRSQGTRQSRPTSTQVELPRSIHISNVAIVDPSTKKPTRVGYRIDGDTKVRVARKSGTVL
jgi:large subunit ribosomal protein L24